MAKRKKYPKLPNGFGSIKYLGKGRRNPYGVYPPVKEYTENGVPITPKALCYVDDWMKGFTVLNSYHAGSYKPGMELGLETSSGGTDKLAQQILADYNRIRGTEYESPKTFAEVYEDFWNWKYENNKAREFSDNTKNCTSTAYKHCKPLHNMPFAGIRPSDMQSMLDDLPLKRGSKAIVFSLLRQIYKYAVDYELVEKDYSSPLRLNQKDDEEHGSPFTHEDLKILWENKENEIIELVLIMCYSGFRISAYKDLEVNLEERYFKGGIKTKASKGRIVPIHPAIYPLVVSRLESRGTLLDSERRSFAHRMDTALKNNGISKHSPHDCRHTFSMLCEEFGVRDNDRKRLLGHSFGDDVTNAVYGHRTLDALRAEIEKIKVI